jgi:hypothetical protein
MLVAALAFAAATGLGAQSLDVPIRLPADDGQMAVCGSSVVAGLDPNGDGFLAVRAGPGTGYAKIGELRNGDVVYPCDARGDWAGVLFAFPKRGRPPGPGGWVHGRWLKPLAG